MSQTKNPPADITREQVNQLYMLAPDDFQATLKTRAWNFNHTDWEEERPDDLETLAHADVNPEKQFEWRIVQIGFENIDGEKTLVPKIHMDTDADHHELALQFATGCLQALWSTYLDIGDECTLTHKELAALMFAESDRITGKMGADILNISDGNFYSKVNKAREKIDEAKATAELAEPFES